MLTILDKNSFSYPGWGSSAFRIMITQLSDGKVQVLYAEEFERPDYNEMLQKTWELILTQPTKIFIDGANPSFIRSLKLQIREDPEHDKVIAEANREKIDYGERMRVIPVNFSLQANYMLGHTNPR
jgi:hypothetical protein